MIIKDTICYTKLLELLRMGDFVKAVENVSFNKPNLDGEGFNGYIETEVTFTVFDIEQFAKCYKMSNVTAETYWSYRNGLLERKIP